MSAISLKSITGITSINTPAGVDNQLTLHNNNTTEAVKLDIAGNLHFHNHLNITGVSTASNFKTGTSNLHNTGLNVFDLDVDGHTNLDNVSIAGVTTISGALHAEGNAIEIKGTMPYLALTDTNSNPDYSLFNLNGVFAIYDGTNSANRLTISASGNVGILQDLDVDGHTNLDNVSIAGVSTFSGELVGSIISVSNSINIADKLIHSGDPDTCIRFPDVDTFTVETNNTERFRIGSNGYIGVGDFSSKSRTDPLNVDSGIGTCNIGGNYIHLKRYSGGGTNYITAPQNNANLYISADDHIVFGVDHSSSMYSHGTEALRIMSSGKIKLGSGGDVVGAANVEIRYDDPVLLIRDTAENSADGDAKLAFGNNTHYPTAYISHVWDGTNGALTFHTRLSGNETEKLRITSNGQVRAGDESASDRTSYRHQFSSTAGAGDVLSLQNPSNSDGQGIGLGFWARNTNNAAIEVAKIKAVADETQANSTQKGSLRFLTNIGASMGERMRITNAGQLYLQANTASGYTAEFRQTHADNPAWIDINSPTDNDLRPAYIQLSRASSKKWGIGMVYSPTSAGSFHIGTGSHSQNNSKFTITTAGRIGVGNVDPGGTPNGSIDITTSDNTTGHGVLTDQRGRSSLVLRNKSGTLYSYTQLMFTNGNDGYNSACFLRHTKGGYLQNENFIGDLILMQRVAGNGSANPDFREKTVWPGGTTKAKQIWWANGTGQEGNATHNGWYKFAEQNPQGTNQYQYFTLDLGASSYSRAGLARYTILWNTGHASGTGHQTGEFRWFNHHSSNGSCALLEHIILRRGYNNGSYYGWNDAPLMALFHSSNTGNDSCIHLRCEGRRSSGYDMGLYVTVFIDLFAPKSSNGNVTPGLRARGYSAPSDMSASEFTNQGRNASYVSYQSSAPPLAQNP